MKGLFFSQSKSRKTGVMCSAQRCRSRIRHLSLGRESSLFDGDTGRPSDQGGYEVTFDLSDGSVNPEEIHVQSVPSALRPPNHTLSIAVSRGEKTVLFKSRESIEGEREKES